MPTKLIDRKLAASYATRDLVERSRYVERTWPGFGSAVLDVFSFTGTIAVA
jgi:hypothetical protein